MAGRQSDVVVKLDSPTYLFPISDDELAIIGRITLMWAQIDMQLDQLLKNLLDLSDSEYDHLFGSRMIGAKAATILKFTSRCRSVDIEALVRGFISSVQLCATDRNLITHGAWGWLWRPELAGWSAAACSRSRANCFEAEGLREFHNRVAATCKQADAVYHRQIMGSLEPERLNRAMFFSPLDPATLPASPQGYER